MKSSPFVVISTNGGMGLCKTKRIPILSRVAILVLFCLVAPMRIIEAREDDEQDTSRLRGYSRQRHHVNSTRFQRRRMLISKSKTNSKLRGASKNIFYHSEQYIERDINSQDTKSAKQSKNNEGGREEASNSKEGRDKASTKGNKIDEEEFNYALGKVEDTEGITSAAQSQVSPGASPGTGSTSQPLLPGTSTGSNSIDRPLDIPSEAAPGSSQPSATTNIGASYPPTSAITRPLEIDTTSEVPLSYGPVPASMVPFWSPNPTPNPTPIPTNSYPTGLPTSIPANVDEASIASAAPTSNAPSITENIPPSTITRPLNVPTLGPTTTVPSTITRPLEMEDENSALGSEQTNGITHPYEIPGEASVSDRNDGYYEILVVNRPIRPEPSGQPSISLEPSNHPSLEPSQTPSHVPSTAPSGLPSETFNPSSLPSESPSLSQNPTAATHTILIVDKPIRPEPSGQPSVSLEPSTQPSTSPTQRPSMLPRMIPSTGRSEVPSSSAMPSMIPSEGPSSIPSLVPSENPSHEPSIQPFVGVSMPPHRLLPSQAPSTAPSYLPSQMPSTQPSGMPSNVPSLVPSLGPSSQPSLAPLRQPSTEPSNLPSQSTIGSVTKSPFHLDRGQDPLPTHQRPLTKPPGEPHSAVELAIWLLQHMDQIPNFSIGFPGGEDSIGTSKVPPRLVTPTPSPEPVRWRRTQDPQKASAVGPTTGDLPTGTGNLPVGPGTPMVGTQKPTTKPTKPPTITETTLAKIPSTTTPTDVPTNLSSTFPTARPTSTPADTPTKLPSNAPTTSPTTSPTQEPTGFPTSAPIEIRPTGMGSTAREHSYRRPGETISGGRSGFGRESRVYTDVRSFRSRKRDNDAGFDDTSNGESLPLRRGWHNP